MTPFARRASLLAVLLLAAALATGCRASRPFVEGVSRGVPLLDRDLRHYAADDVLRQSQADGLQALAKDEPRIDADSVDAAWSPVKAWYLPAVDADPRLDEPKRAARRRAADGLDKLIADERRRPFRLP
ncbi:MAG TPA: hypothetical protein VF796_27525 [Humisphaera sp.]